MPAKLLYKLLRKRVRDMDMNLVLWIWSTRTRTRTHTFLPLSPSGWRVIVVTVRAGGRAGGCQTCGTHISVTAWRIFSIRSSVELSRPVVVYCHGHLPICPIRACPWAKNLSNLPQIGSRLCGTHISETAGCICSSRGLVVSHRLATRKVLCSPPGLCKGCYSPWLLTIPH